MSRRWSCGFENQSLTSGMEFDSFVGSGSPNITISTTTVRSGAASLRLHPTPTTTHTTMLYQFISANNTGNFYCRFYMNIAALPTSITNVAAGGNSDVVIFAFAATNNGTWCELSIDASGVLRMYRDGSDRGVIGTSSALSLNTDYMIEVGYGSATSYVEARINGVSIGSTTSAPGLSGVAKIALGLGVLSEDCFADIFYDDIAINDTAGSFQTSWPGSGKIIHLKPNATGDANAFSFQNGGTAGSANNFTRVNEVPPDDAATRNGSATLNNEDLFNVGNSGIAANDTVNVVAVGGRYSDNIADATAAFKFEIEKTASGTITQSAAIIPNSTTWRTNANAAPKNHPIILYQDPDGAAWTQTTLDSMQIGYKLTTAGTNRIQLSNVWALVDYTPYVPPSTTGSNLLTLGV